MTGTPNDALRRELKGQIDLRSTTKTTKSSASRTKITAKRSVTLGYFWYRLFNMTKTWHVIL